MLSTYIFLFLVGLVAGVINTVAGGGSILTLPALIILADIPAVAANATNRIGILAQSSVALFQFRKGGVQEDAFAWRVTIFGVFGAIFGAWLALQIPNDSFEKILGALMPFLLIAVLKKPSSIDKSSESNSAKKDLWASFSTKRKSISAFFFFLLGIYAGFLQAGVGIFTLIALNAVASLDLVRGNYVKIVFVLVLNSLAFLVFLWNGVEIAWIAGLVMTLGAICGASIGSWVALKKGATWIRVILILSIVLSSAKLLGLF